MLERERRGGGVHSIATPPDAPHCLSQGVMQFDAVA